MAFASYWYRASFLQKENIYFPDGVQNGEDLCFKYQAFLAAKTIEYTGHCLYYYKYNEKSVTHSAVQYAPVYYIDLIKGWQYLRNWSGKRKDSDSIKMVSFAEQKEAHTCLWCAKNYCQWHNGSYNSFINHVIIPYFKENEFPSLLNKTIKKETDPEIAADYQLLYDKPKKFYHNYYIEGCKTIIRQKIKSILRRSR